MSEKTAAQKKAQKAYMQKFARVELRMTLQNRESVQAHAAARGESVNAFINRAIRNQIERYNESDGE